MVWTLLAITARGVLAMAHIIDFRDGGFSQEEIKLLEKLGAEFFLDELQLPENHPCAILPVDASLLDLMTPPLCPWCREMMDSQQENDRSGNHIIFHTCPACGGVEKAVRYKPQEKESEPD